MSIDEEWSNFLDNNEDINITKPENRYCNDSSLIPKCSDIYISTKTKIIYLNKELLDIYSIFWKIKIEDYDKQVEGIIKKQIKISCNTKEELEILENLIKNESYYVSKIINYVDNPNGRIKFKDVRKISVGLCKKDLIYTRTKEKSAFYNCFVVTLRVLYKGLFKEIHVKIFNTGKLEIPGIQNDEILEIVLINIVKILEEILNNKLEILYDKTENVLINSNFNCGYYIDRSKLYEILRTKYNISCSYDACSYPGIQSVFCYDTSKDPSQQDGQLRENNDNISKVSFMIFRTGSALIVGKCTENIIHTIYNFLVKLFIAEYQNINCGRSSTEAIKKKPAKKKKTIIIAVHSN